MFGNLDQQLIVKHKPTVESPWLELEFIEREDISSFVQFVNGYSNLTGLNNLKQGLFFRGQADSGWGLVPKLCRLLKGIELEEALRLEYDSIIYFKDHAPIFLKPQLIPEKEDFGGWLAMMQHYNAPTRMLDWTTSFTYALYFAVHDESFDKNGAVWIFNISEMYQAMTPIGPCLTQKDVVEMFESEETYVEYGLKKAKLVIDGYDASIKDHRMLAQHGVFTFCQQLFCDQAYIIGRALWEENKLDVSKIPLLKIIINPSAKRNIRGYLNKLGITANLLFPGIDGVGKSVSEIIRVYCDEILKRPASQK